LDSSNVNSTNLAVFGKRKSPTFQYFKFEKKKKKTKTEKKKKRKKKKKKNPNLLDSYM